MSAVNPQTPSTPEAERRFMLVLWFVMLISVCMYFVVVRLVPPQGASENPTLVNVLVVLAVLLAGGSFVVKRKFNERARGVNKASVRRAGFLLGIVMCEAAALFGVVVWFVTGSPQYYLFLIIGIVGMVLHFPTGSAD